MSGTRTKAIRRAYRIKEAQLRGTGAWSLFMRRPGYNPFRRFKRAILRGESQDQLKVNL